MADNEERRFAKASDLNHAVPYRDEILASNDIIDGAGRRTVWSQQAVAYVARLSGRRLLALSLAEKAQLIKDIVAFRHVNALPDEALAQIKRIYHNSSLDPAYLRYKRQTRRAVAEQIAAIPALRRLQCSDGSYDMREWQKLTQNPDDLHAFVQQLTYTMLRALGTGSLPRIRFFVDPSSPIKKYRSYSSATNTLSMNIHGSVLEPEHFINTIFHEASHAAQSSLIRKFERGEIGEGDPRYQQTAMFSANQIAVFRMGNRINWEEYRESPVEEDARRQADRMQDEVIRFLPASRSEELPVQLARTSDRQLEELPLLTKAEMVVHLAANYYPSPEIVRQVDRLYKASPPSEEYLRWHQHQAKKGARAVAQLPELRNLFHRNGQLSETRWNAMKNNPAALKAMAEAISRNFLQEMGGAPARVEIFDQPGRMVRGYFVIDAGEYQPDRKTISLNINPGALLSLEAFVHLIVHQSIHKDQYSLIDMLNDGRISPSHSIHDQLSMFGANKAMFIPATQLGFINQPLEVAARELADRVMPEITGIDASNRNTVGAARDRNLGTPGAEGDYWKHQAQSQNDKMMPPNLMDARKKLSVH